MALVNYCMILILITQETAIPGDSPQEGKKKKKEEERRRKNKKE